MAKSKCQPKNKDSAVDKRLASKKAGTSLTSVQKEPSMIWKVYGELLGLVIAFLMLTFVMPLSPFVTDEYWLFYGVGLFAALAHTLFKSLGHLSTKWLKPVFNVTDLAVSIYSTWKLVEIFPFDFALIGISGFNEVLRMVFYVSIFGMTIAMIVNLILIPASFFKAFYFNPNNKIKS